MQKLPKYTWLALAPLLIVVGVLLTKIGNESTSDATTQASGSANRDFWLVTCSLLCALFVSIVGVVVAAKRRDLSPPANRGSRRDLLRLVQSLRISSRHWIHAVEFESEIILIGACDGNLVLLSGAPDPKDEELSKSVNFSDEGVDLLDTPIPEEDTSDRLRNLADINSQREVGRTALNAANLADFKSKIRLARKSAHV